MNHRSIGRIKDKALGPFSDIAAEPHLEYGNFTVMAQLEENPDVKHNIKVY